MDKTDAESKAPGLLSGFVDRSQLVKLFKKIFKLSLVKHISGVKEVCRMDSSQCCTSSRGFTYGLVSLGSLEAVHATFSVKLDLYISGSDINNALFCFDLTEICNLWVQPI